jgi:hypothetical protein
VRPLGASPGSVGGSPLPNGQKEQRREAPRRVVSGARSLRSLLRGGGEGARAAGGSSLQQARTRHAQSWLTCLSAMLSTYARLRAVWLNGAPRRRCAPSLYACQGQFVGGRGLEGPAHCPQGRRVMGHRRLLWSHVSRCCARRCNLRGAGAEVRVRCAKGKPAARS